MRKAILPIFAALGLAITPAASASEKFEVDFEYSTIEVATEEGAEKIYADLEAVIEHQCEADGLALSGRALERLRSKALTAECVDRSIASAVEQMQSSELAEIHKAKRG